MQFTVRQRSRGIGNGAVVDQGGAITMAGFDVSIHGVKARVEATITEPPIERRIGIIENRRGSLNPINELGCLTPESNRIANTARIRRFVVAC